jgi:acetylornithine deacetylase/succinyl-diaminopimelate desuccinylase-like protein
MAEFNQTWTGAPCSIEQFRHDAGVLAGVDLLGGDVADMIWGRPAVTVLGIDCPPVAGSTGAIQAAARARISLRVPPGMDPTRAQAALVDHLRSVGPWHVRLDVGPELAGAPFTASVDGPAFRAMAAAMHDIYRRDVTVQGDGGSIPLCNVLQETFPDAEILLLGVEEPLCRIHASNDSVDLTEIENMALVETLFLLNYATTATGRDTAG